MSNNLYKEKSLETLIAEVNELLVELKEEQKNMKLTIDKYHKVNMQKFSKLLEYNEILDMTNTVFEKRLSRIESVLYTLINKDY